MIINTQMVLMFARPREGCPENTVPMAIPVDIQNKMGMGLLRPRSSSALKPNKLPNKVPISCCAHGHGTSSLSVEVTNIVESAVCHLICTALVSPNLHIATIYSPAAGGGGGGLGQVHSWMTKRLF